MTKEDERIHDMELRAHCLLMVFEHTPFDMTKTKSAKILFDFIKKGKVYKPPVHKRHKKAKKWCLN